MTDKRYQTAKRASIISAAINGLLAIFKVVIGIFGHSHALVADGIHSFSDLITDGLVIIAAKAGGRMPDEEHPYGHRRIETIAAIIIAIILVFVAGSILAETISHLMAGKPQFLPDYTVIIAAIVSIFANEWLYRFMLAVGKKIHSNLLISNAWHNRSDALTSIIVLISVIGTLLGFYYLDAVGAIIIAIFILKIGIDIMWKGTKELIDTAVDKTTLAKIRHTIKQVAGVKSIHQLRTRSHSGHIFIDVHIIVDPFISVSEGHHIGEEVHSQLLQAIAEIADVTVHIDVEDDEKAKPSLHLPNREKMNSELQQRWQALPGFNKIHKITYHYLNGKLYIEIVMPQNVVAINKQQQLIKSYRKAVENIDEIANLIIHFIPIEDKTQ